MNDRIQIRIPERSHSTSGILNIPDSGMRAFMVLSHGAGAGIEHPFMVSIAEALARSGIGTLRFNFLYMEMGRKATDKPPVAHMAILAAVAKAVEYTNGVPLLGGGKSFGGRMFSQVAAEGLIPQVKALIFYGFPLHPPAKPGTERAQHLDKVGIPMLFLQGTRDRLAQNVLIQEVCDRLDLATLDFLDMADHSFHPLKRSGYTQEDMIVQLAQNTREWVDKLF